ncbi:hypothetical protein HPB52_019703 [Rhipicephalus sanguineus]|uniref:Uncharacterized protein n=1 Tax=Rhipicephalus sanguineus TaxID=34632 RepID=A0A9D4SPB2_RHISA|nr:hypothetical protein HPB52_019703 [Rhipicephalus sanguineus]
MHGPTNTGLDSIADQEQACGPVSTVMASVKETQVANCFAQAGFSHTIVGLVRAIVSDPDDDQPDDDWTCSNLCEAVYKIAGQEVESVFEMFVFTDAAAPVVASAMDAKIIDNVGGLD